MSSFGHFLTVLNKPSQSDAIVVLGGNVDRVQPAIELFDEEYAPLVVFSGGTVHNDGLTCSTAQLSLAAARELGLPPAVSIVADGAQSTYDEAVNLRQLAREHGWHTLIVVTDPLHTRRAGLTFRTLLPDMTIYLSAASRPNYDAARWWRTREGATAVLSEMIKLIFYWVKYGISPFGP